MRLKAALTGVTVAVLVCTGSVSAGATPLPGSSPAVTARVGARMPSAAPADTAPPRRTPPPRYTGGVIVSFKSDISARQRREALSEASAESSTTLATRRQMSGSSTWLITGARPASAKTVAATLAKRPEVASAEPDRILVPTGTPDDPYWPQQWDLAESATGIGVARVWEAAQGEGVTVAVVDTGIRPHADFGSRILPGYDFIADTGTAADGNGRDADAYDPGDACDGYNSSWHGTHVAGTIAATTGNGLAVAGIAPRAKILPVRVLGRCGGYLSDIIDGVTWASGGWVSGVPTNPNKAKVINLSLGMADRCSTSPAMQSAITNARSRGSMVVTAAGNDGIDAAYFTPGSCTGVVNVGATTSTGALGWFSNRGAAVTLSAPGANILSTWNSGTTGPGADAVASMNGTSMAAPHVSGVAALVAGTNPTMTPDQIRDRIKGAVKPFPATCSGCGAGILDAARSVLVPPVVTGMSPRSGSPAGGSAVTITGSRFTGATSVTFGNAPATIRSVTATSISVLSAPQPPGAPATVPVTVTTPMGSSAPVSVASWTYVAPVPRLSSASPSTLPVTGGLVRFYGSGLAGVTSVSVAGQQIIPKTVTATYIEVLMPPLPEGPTTGIVPVTASNPWTTGPAFSFRYTIPLPRISGLSPASGAPEGGYPVRITGTNLASAQKITVGSVPVSGFTVNADGSLSFTMPRMAAGSTASVPVVVTNVWGSSPGYTFTYVFPTPAISSLSPRSGTRAGGTTLVIYGSNLTTAKRVTVAGVDAPVMRVDSASRITVTTPPSPTGSAGQVRVVVHTDWTASAQNYYSTYTYL